MNPNTNENMVHFQPSGLLRADFNNNIMLNNNHNSDSSKGEQNNYKTGRWNNTEHMRFIQGCLLHGNNWRKVKDCVKTRSSAQIRSHAQKYLIKLCKKYKIQDNKDGKSSKNVRNKKKLKNDLSDEFLIDNAILEQNPNLINIQDVEQKILKIFKSNLTANLNKDDSLKFEDNDSEGSQNVLKQSGGNNGKLFETFKISKKQKHKQKSKTNSNLEFQMNPFMMGNNMPGNNFLDNYMFNNFNNNKNMNPNLISLMSMPMDNNPAINNNDFLNLLFQQYQNNLPLLDTSQMSFPGYNSMDNGLTMPFNIVLPNLPNAGANEGMNPNAGMPSFPMFPAGGNKNELENLLKMIYTNQGPSNEAENPEAKGGSHMMQNNNMNLLNNSTSAEAKNSFLGQKKNSSYNMNDQQYLFEAAENINEKNDANNLQMNTNFNNFGGDYPALFGFDAKFLQNNPGFNFAMNPMNPMMNDKQVPNMLNNDNLLNLGEGFNPANVKREEGDNLNIDPKNNLDFNQLLAGGDPNMFFGFPQNPGNNNIFENLFMNLQNGGMNPNSNMFDLDSKNLLNSNINNQHPNQ